jgi:hypothetical protein
VTVVCRHAEDVVRLVLRHQHVCAAGGTVLTVVTGAPRAAAPDGRCRSRAALRDGGGRGAGRRGARGGARDDRRPGQAHGPLAARPSAPRRPPAAAEVDLLSADLRIAVENDGWHHSRAADRDRLDRRKDVALQEERYLVPRYLAEDITDNPAAIAAKIREAVRDRIRSGRHLEGSP